MELTPFHGPPAAVPQIPGLVAETLLGFGAHGEVWRAEDVATGLPVAVKIGRARPGEPAGDDVMARETALLARIRHPHVVRFHRVVHLPGGSLALVLDLAGGGSLASLVAGRGPLAPGEVSTLLVPLADALQHLHERGVAHGDISPGNVLFTDDGRPQLGDLGVGRLLGERRENVWSTPGFTDPADGSDPRAADLWGLAAIGWFAHTGEPPAASGDPRVGAGELLGVLGRVLAAAPESRPSPAEFAAEVWRVARPVPIRLVTEVASLGLDAGLPPLSARVTRRVTPALQPAPQTVVTADRPRGERASRWPVWRVTVALGAVSLVLGALTAVVVPRVVAAPASSRAETPAPVPLDEQVRAALDRVGAARAGAFRTLSVEALADADAPGSSAERSDRALVERLRAAGYRLEGVRYEMTAVRVLSRAESSVVVRASVTTSSHRRVGSGAATDAQVAAVPPDGPRAVVITLRTSRDTAGWRVSDVGPAT